MPASRACAREGARERGERDSPSLGLEESMSDDDKALLGRVLDFVIAVKIAGQKNGTHGLPAPYELESDIRSALARCGGA